MNSSFNSPSPGVSPGLATTPLHIFARKHTERALGEGGLTGTIIGADDTRRAPATDKLNPPNRGARAGGCSPRFRTARAREWRDPSDREKRDIVLAGVLPASPAVSSLPAGHAQALTRPQDARFRHWNPSPIITSASNPQTLWRATEEGLRVYQTSSNQRFCR